MDLVKINLQSSLEESKNAGNDHYEIIKEQINIETQMFKR